MKTYAGLLVALVVLQLILTGCSKNEELSKTELVSKRSWILKVYTTTRLSDGLVTDAFAPMSTCYKDDQYVFKPDMSYEGNAGATKCDPSDPQVFSTGSWRFKNNETVLERIITSGVSIGSLDFTVVSLSNTEMHLSVNDGIYRHDVKYAH